jgi:uroporphyrinogen-III synthase
MRLLLTRPLVESEALAEVLKERGLDTCISPVMEIVPQTLELPPNAPFQAVLLTSGNAVDALSQAGLRPDIPILCVGDATARRLAGSAFADVRSAAGDSGDLVALAIRDLAPEDGPLLYLSGMVIAADIASALSQAGFTVDRRVAYRARAIPAADEAAVADLAAGNIDGVLLYSPRSARIFVDHLRQANLELIAREMTAYCISDATAEAAGAVAWRKLAVAARPNQHDLLALLSN